MREVILPQLVCPVSGESLELRVFERDADEIMEGELFTASGRCYNITRGVPGVVSLARRGRGMGVVDGPVERDDFGPESKQLASGRPDVLRPGLLRSVAASVVPC